MDATIVRKSPDDVCVATASRAIGDHKRIVYSFDLYCCSREHWEVLALVIAVRYGIGNCEVL